MEKKQAILVPMIALRGMSIFPGMAISFPAGRQKSLDALQAAEENGKEIFLVTQKDPVIPDPSRNDLYDIGVLAEVTRRRKFASLNELSASRSAKFLILPPTPTVK